MYLFIGLQCWKVKLTFLVDSFLNRDRHVEAV